MEKVRLDQYAQPGNFGKREEDVNCKNIGTKLKKMWVLAAFAIIAVIITHFVGLAPISDQANSISEQAYAHMSYAENRETRYDPHNEDECSKCIAYEEAKAENDQQAAMLWQGTITYGVLIAFAGAVVYGVGTIAEKVCKSDNE